MKLTFSIILLFLSTFHLFAQSDSSKIISARNVTFHISNGVNVLQNEKLRTLYDTKSLYFFGLGIRVSSVQTKSPLTLAMDYNFSSYTYSSEIRSTTVDSLLRMDQLVTSFSIQLFEVKDLAFKAQMGYIFTFLTDKMHNQAGNPNGATLGLAIEKKLSKNQAFQVFLNYDLMKLDGQTYRDYDVLKMGVGLYL
jgi:hypothetical protein